MTGTPTARNTAEGLDSWSRRGMLRALIIGVGVGTLLTACGDGGFRPLYASPQFGGANVSEKLAHVEFAPIPGRVGQRIRNELIFQSTGGGGSQQAVYRMEIAVSTSLTSTLVKSDGNPLSSIVNLDVSFRLIRISDKKVVLEGKSFGRASFERFPSIFANVRAQEDAENRAAKTVGEELRTRLSAYLATAT